MPAFPRTRVGPYEIVSLLGEGGMGQVYRARDDRLGREVALKVLQPSSSEAPERQRRFLREARAAGSLNHPNIVAVYDVGFDASLPYIVSEFVEGTSLRSALDDGPLSVERTLQLAAQIADGLAAAHRAGFVHCDLKPENIMVTRDGRVKIVDFGLAKPVAVDGVRSNPDITLTAPHVVLGTASYMSPEQARGAQLDFRSDIFAFGAVLYEMLTAHRAFGRETVIDTLSAVLSSNPPRVHELNAACPEELERLIERCLAKSPEERYAATADLHHDLVALRDHPHQHPAAAVPAKARRPGAWAAVWLLLASLAGGAMLWRSSVNRAGVDLSAYRILPVATEAAYEGEAAWSPDGRTLTYVAEVDGILQVMIRSVDPTGTSREAVTAARLTNAPADCQHPFWSHDGTRVFYISQARTRDALWSVSTAGGRPSVVIEEASYAALAPDGSIVFLREAPGGRSNRYALWIKAPGDAEARRFAPEWTGEGTLGAGFLQFAPDGSAFALWASPSRRTHPSAGFDDAEMWLFSYPSGASRRVLPALKVARSYSLSWMPDGRDVVFGADFVGSLPGARLWKANLDTGRMDPLTATTAREYDPAVSPDGATIAFTSDTSHYDVIEVSLEGSPPRARLDSARDEAEPVWAPTGGQFAYVTDRDGSPGVWLADPSQPLFNTPVVQTSQFAGGKTYLLSRLAFSPAGDRLVYQRRDADGYYLWVSMLAGGPAVRLVLKPEFEYQDAPTWSPDGQWVAFVFVRDLMFGLAKVRPGSNEAPEVILDRLPRPCDPHWSPDGETITCQQDDGLYLVSADGESRRPLTDDVWLAHDWSPEGARLYGIRENDDLHLELVAVETRTKEIVVGEDLGPSPPAVAPVRGFSVSPDGRRVLLGLLRLRGDIHLVQGFASH